MNEPIKTKKSVIAYLDLLGVKDKILNDTPNEDNLNIIRKLYNEAISFKNIHKGPLSLFNTVKIKIFSDNIVFIQEIDNELVKTDIEAIYRIIETVVNFQFYAFVDYGWLLRGGVVKNLIYADDDMVWGRALLSGYEIESKIAIYPRVVIDDEVMNIINSSSSTMQKLIHTKRDSDGVYFIDYLHTVLCDELDQNFVYQFEDKLKSIRNNVVKFLSIFPTDQSPSSKSIRDKYSWQLNYYNDIMNKANLKEYSINPNLISDVLMSHPK